MLDLAEEDETHLMVAIGGGHVQRGSAACVLVLQQLRRPAISTFVVWKKPKLTR